MEHLRKLVQHFRDQGVEAPRASDDLYKHIEETFLPHLLRVIKKDNTLFEEVDIFPGIKVTWDGSDESWKVFHMALLNAVLHGDPKEKFGKVTEALKGVFPQADEISTILEDEDTKSSMSEILELLMSTRLATVVSDMIQSMDFSNLGLDLEDPEKLMEMMRNPQESPVLSELMDRARGLLEDRIKSGKINQDELRREIEMLRAKFQSSFGKYLNEALIGTPGNTTGNTASQIMSNHPEARRARMIARLQKRQQEKARK
jgi:hypothetical protein